MMPSIQSGGTQGIIGCAAFTKNELCALVDGRRFFSVEGGADLRL